MMNAYLTALLATAVEMNTCLICARQLWRARAEVKDSSRWLLALGSLLGGLLATAAVIGSLVADPAPVSTQLLSPWPGLIFMSMHIVMTLYPITVVRSDWLTPLRYFLLFLPVAFFSICCLFFIGRWTPLETPQAIWENILRPDVIVRLATLFVMVPYCLILLWLPYNRRESSASIWWIIQYCLGLSLLCGTHIVLMLTYHPALLIALPLLAATFYLRSTEYELRDRLRPSKAVMPVASEDLAQEPGLEEEDLTPEFGLWTRVKSMINQEEVWRNPDLTLISLARDCGTNVTYLNRILREETGKSFKELINGKRIACVVAQLQKNPDMDIQEAFFNAGYRSRATAWRNFKDIMHLTPTEFRQSLKG